MLGGGFVPGSSEAGVFALLELLADPKAVKERLSQLKDAQKPLERGAGCGGKGASECGT